MESYINFKEALDPAIIRALNGQCICGYPLPTLGDILTNNRDFICPKCGADHTPYNDLDEE